MKDRIVLVVGGAGFIGSYVNKMLCQKDYRTLVLDNLSRGHRETVLYGHFIEGDLADKTLLDHIFETFSIDAVMHFAASIDIGESVKNPSKYYHNNVVNTLNLLNAMVKHEVKNLIFSSTAAIFGHPQEPFITEDHPCCPINPYGESKWMIEKIIQSYSMAYELKFCCLRYFNAAGGDPEGEIKNYQLQTSNLIPRLLLSLRKSEGSIHIYGSDYPTRDGTCIRDYIHIADLGEAHITALNQLLSGAPSNFYNLGNGNGFSVREVIQTAEIVLNKKFRVIEGNRRPGDPPVLLANAEKALHKLNWQPRYSLEDMIQHAWNSLRGC